MMNPIYGYMYTRPGNLVQSFEVFRCVTENRQGYRTDHYEKSDQEPIRGILSVAGNSDAERTMHLFDQDQHSLTHVLALGRKADVGKGDMLVCNDLAYLVLTTDNESMVGGSSILYLEERNDLK